MGFAPPKSVVLAFCRKALGCIIDEEDFVCPVKPQDPSSVLSNAEMIAFNVLRENGPLLHRVEFERLSVKRGMNRTTFNLYLTRCPIIARYAPSIYGIRGTVFSATDLEKLSIPRSAERFSDHGWTDTAQPWVALEVTPSMVTTGIAHIPAGINDLVIGRYTLKTEQGDDMGKLVISEHAAWGLKSFFQRYGGEIGDVLVLTFDTREHKTTARVGEKKTVMPELVWSVEEIENRKQA
jgi:hypothetical protein